MRMFQFEQGRFESRPVNYVQVVRPNRLKRTDFAFDKIQQFKRKHMARVVIVCEDDESMRRGGYIRWMSHL